MVASEAAVVSLPYYCVASAAVFAAASTTTTVVVVPSALLLLMSIQFELRLPLRLLLLAVLEEKTNFLHQSELKLFVY